MAFADEREGKMAMRTIGAGRWMANLVLAAVAAAAALAPAQARDASPLRALTTADESRDWDGVGRIELGGDGFCTGALISERLVLTAAHCLYGKSEGRLLPAAEMTFLAGWRDGRAAAHREVRRAIPHPRFDPSADLMGVLRYDLALLELSHPIRNGQIGAFATRNSPREGYEIGVVSYAHDRADRPALQEVCEVIGSDEGFLVMSCEADFGSSGAPVFVNDDGRPAIVSVISAKAQLRGRKVSLGSDLAQPLAELMALLARGDGVFHRDIPPVTGQTGTSAAGAKFLRP